MIPAVRLLFMLLLFVALLWGGLWWWAADRLEQQFLRWQEKQAAEDRDFHFNKAEISGFPFRLRLHLSQPSLTDRNGWSWRGPDTAAEAFLWQPRRVFLLFPGNHELLPPQGARLAPIAFSAAKAQGQLWLDRQERVEALALVFERLALSGLFAGGTSAKALKIGWGTRALETSAGDTREGADPQRRPFFLDIQELELPSALEPPLGRSLERLLAEGALEGPLPTGTAGEAITAWAGQGGGILLDRLELAWGPLELEGTAEVALDQRRRPAGAGQARILGFEESLEAFVEAGLIKKKAAKMTGLALLALSSEDSEGRRQIEARIKAQDGVLSLGPFPLLPLPPLF